MASIMLTGPAAEPLTLAEAKDFLRVTQDDDDSVITALIASARVLVEAQTRRALITQQWRIVRDAWPTNGRVWIAPSPLIAITAARVYESDGTTVTIDPENFAFNAAAAPAHVSFAPWAVPQPGRLTGGIEIDITVGYGGDASAVPEPLRQAMRLLIAHWYENRAVVASTTSVLPASVSALLAPFRVVSL
jgi:uncharacterized phiE125 gp8 family phage protein